MQKGDRVYNTVSGATGTISGGLEWRGSRQTLAYGVKLDTGRYTAWCPYNVISMEQAKSWRLL